MMMEKDFFSKQSNRVLRFTGILFLLIVLLTVFISSWMLLTWMKDTQCLLLSKLIITGDRHYTRNDDIRQLILNLGLPMTFMAQDVNIIKVQIERLPWIKRASVRKQWPDVLKVHLIEYVPIAYWNDQYMVDADGNSFDAFNSRGKQKDLPKLYGPEDSKNEVLQGFHEISQVLAKNFFMLKDATMTTRHSWKLTLTNGIKLNLGRIDTINRLLRFVEIYPALQQQMKINGKQINYVDLRYESGAAVGWNPSLVRKPN